MTREEEINNAVKEFREKRKTAIGRAENGGWYFPDIFREGIKWADSHPVNVWYDAKIFTPTQDKEVIVLCDDIHCGSNYKIAFGHIVDKTKCVDYNGWNIPNVVLWMLCPQIPYEKEE